jgi:hypothetical protein
MQRHRSNRESTTDTVPRDEFATFEVALRTLSERVRTDDAFAHELYGALCDLCWRRRDVDREPVSMSWRYAGDVVSHLACESQARHRQPTRSDRRPYTGQAGRGSARHSGEVTPRVCPTAVMCRQVSRNALAKPVFRGAPTCWTLTVAVMIRSGGGKTFNSTLSRHFPAASILLPTAQP